MAKVDEAARARRRERDKKARDDLADWYVRKLVVASWGPIAAEAHREELIKLMRVMVQLKRACREAIKKGNR